MASLELPGSANALFASSLQRSDRPNAAQVRAAIAAALSAFGDSGCRARLAQEFGDHPEIAVPRMRWARATVACIIAGSEPPHLVSRLCLIYLESRIYPQAYE
jgi:hypothetical protein